MPAPKSQGVATRHPDFDKYQPKWKRCRDVSDGQDAIRAAGEAYLPKLKDETSDDYKARLKRSNFFNGTWRTLAVLTGMLFRKPPQKDVPSGIETYLEDIDLAGTSLDTFARTVALEVEEVGRVGIMVDHPAVENVEALTVAAAQAQGLRPLIQFYRAESIINWKYARIRNRNQLSMVVLKECISEPDGEFAEKKIDQYRVLDLDAAGEYRVRIFRRENDRDVQIGSDMYPLMNGQKLDFIPFRIVGPDGSDSVLDEPPLIDLVDANLAHYQINADYRHGLHFTALPTAVISGYVPESPNDKLYIGSTSAWVFPDPNATAAFLEFQGQGLSELREALREIKQEMALLGARAIADETKQAETLGATAIKRSGENSILSAIAIAVSESIEWALTIFAEWAGQSGDVEYQLNRDFMPAMIDAQQLTALVSAVQAGKISDAEFFALMQRGDVIDSEITFEEHQAQVEIDGPDLARPTLKPKPGEEAAA